MLAARNNYESIYEQYNPAYERAKKSVVSKPQISKPKKSKKVSKKSRVLTSIAVCFVLAFIIVLRYVMITEMAGTINKQEKYLSSLEKTNSQLVTETMIDLKTVDDVAKTKLGMDKPYKHQIVYVDLNQNVKTAANNQTNPKGFQIVKKLSKVVEYLY